jgi:hypothetical protein
VGEINSTCLVQTVSSSWLARLGSSILEDNVGMLLGRRQFFLAHTFEDIYYTLQTYAYLVSRDRWL